MSVDGNVNLITQIIEKELKIRVCAMMGANVADEIADEKFSETTIGKFLILHMRIMNII